MKRAQLKRLRLFVAATGRYWNWSQLRLAMESLRRRQPRGRVFWWRWKSRRRCWPSSASHWGVDGEGGEHGAGAAVEVEFERARTDSGPPGSPAVRAESLEPFGRVVKRRAGRYYQQGAPMGWDNRVLRRAMVPSLAAVAVRETNFGHRSRGAEWRRNRAESGSNAKLDASRTVQPRNFVKGCDQASRSRS
jgi:hypothetical protein